MILKLVKNFGSYPDGRIRMGPFACSSDRLQETLEHHRLRVSLGKDPAYCSQTAFGLFLSAAGPAVQGVLLDEDGLEVGETDLQYFLEDILQNGQSLTLEGHVTYEPGVMTETRLTALKIGGEVQRSYRKTLYRDGCESRVLEASGGFQLIGDAKLAALH